MVSLLILIVEDYWFKPKTMKLVFAASPLGMQY
jgi:hypothetical protein